jgi:hypothetical protein
LSKNRLEDSSNLECLNQEMKEINKLNLNAGKEKESKKE